jgi:uncharacterized membrane protein YjjP (DUF1212 family)
MTDNEQVLSLSDITSSPEKAPEAQNLDPALVGLYEGELEDRQMAFVVLLTKMIISSGGGGYDSENRINEVCTSMGLDGNVVLLPFLFLLYGNKNTQIHRTSVSWNMDRYQSLRKFMKQVINHEVSFEEAVEELVKIREKKPRVPELVYFYVLFPLTSFLTAPALFGSEWLTAPFSALFSLPVAVACHLQRHYTIPPYVSEFIACTVVGFFSIITSHYMNQCFQSVAFAAIVWLLPGLSITLSAIELGTNNLISGSARLISNIFFSAILAYGLTLGGQIAAWLPYNQVVTQICPNISSNNLLIAFLTPVLVASLGLLLGARWQQIPPMLIVGWIGWFVTRAMSTTTTITNNFVTSAVISTCACLWAELVQQHTYVPITFSGIEILVPGSLSVKALLSVEFEESGSHFGQTIIEVIIGLFLGINLTFWLVPPVIRYVKTAFGIRNR